MGGGWYNHITSLPVVPPLNGCCLEKRKQKIPNKKFLVIPKFSRRWQYSLKSSGPTKFAYFVAATDAKIRSRYLTGGWGAKNHVKI